MSKKVTINEAIEKCRNDINAFAEFTLDVRQAKCHKCLQNHLDLHNNPVVRFPRGHGKTTQVAARCAFVIGRRPDARIKYVQQTDTEATKTTKMIRAIIQSRRFQLVFPGIAIDPDEKGIRKFRVVVEEDKVAFKPRGGSLRDATVEGCGIFGRAGGRFDIGVFDDICDLKNAVQQPLLREQVKDAYNNTWLPMRDYSATEEPQTWTVGTPYHIDDILANISESRPHQVLSMPVEDFKSPWPEAYSKSRLEQILDEIGPQAYARAYELIPVSTDEIMFPMEWLEAAFYDADTAQMSVWQSVASIDYAFSDSRAGTDWSVILCSKVSPDGKVYVTRMERHRCDFPSFCDMIGRVCNEEKIQQLVAETNGPQKGITQALRKNVDVSVVGMNRVLDKRSRASAVQAHVRAGRFRLPTRNNGLISQIRPLFEEMTVFPSGGHDDTVDAAIDLIANYCRDSMTFGSVRFNRPGALDRLYGNRR